MPAPDITAAIRLQDLYTKEIKKATVSFTGIKGAFTSLGQSALSLKSVILGGLGFLALKKIIRGALREMMEIFPQVGTAIEGFKNSIRSAIGNSQALSDAADQLTVGFRLAGQQLIAVKGAGMLDFLADLVPKAEDVVAIVFKVREAFGTLKIAFYTIKLAAQVLFEPIRQVGNYWVAVLDALYTTVKFVFGNFKGVVANAIAAVLETVSDFARGLAETIRNSEVLMKVANEAAINLDALGGSAQATAFELRKGNDIQAETARYTSDMSKNWTLFTNGLTSGWEDMKGTAAKIAELSEEQRQLQQDTINAKNAAQEQIQTNKEAGKSFASTGLGAGISQFKIFGAVAKATFQVAKDAGINFMGSMRGMFSELGLQRAMDTSARQRAMIEDSQERAFIEANLQGILENRIFATDEEKKMAEDLAAFKRQVQDQTIQDTASMFGALGQLAKAGGNRMFKVAQAFGLAETLVAGVTAIQKAASALPFPANIPGIITETARMAVNLATIRAARPGSGGGGSRGGGGGGGSSVSAVRARESATLRRDRDEDRGKKGKGQQLNITINGAVLGGSDPQMNRALQRSLQIALAGQV